MPELKVITDPGAPEKLLTVQAAADVLGVPLWKLRLAVKAGLIPTYTLFNKRRLVRVSEVLAAIDASRQGGRDD